MTLRIVIEFLFAKIQRITACITILIFLNSIPLGYSIASACTTFLTVEQGGIPPLICKSYDWYNHDGIAFLNKRKKHKTAIGFKHPKTWKSKYYSISFNQFGREFPNGGMNEKGLVIEAMVAPNHYPTKYDKKKKYISPSQWIQYILDTSHDLDKAREKAEEVTVRNHINAYIFGEKQPIKMPTAHYLVCENKKGKIRCAVFEYINVKKNLKLTEKSFKKLKKKDVEEDILNKLRAIENQSFKNAEKFIDAIQERIGVEQTALYQNKIFDCVAGDDKKKLWVSPDLKWGEPGQRVIYGELTGVPGKYLNQEMPLVPVLANSSYAYSVRKLKDRKGFCNGENCKNLDIGFKKPYGDHFYKSVRRFIRAAYTGVNYNPELDSKKHFGFSALQYVRIKTLIDKEATQWQIVYDPSQLEVYYRVIKCGKKHSEVLHAIKTHLKKVKYRDCLSHAMHIKDMSKPKSDWVNYTDKMNVDLLTKSLSTDPFKKQIKHPRLAAEWLTNQVQANTRCE